MSRYRVEKPAQVRDFDMFEELVVSLFSAHMPHFDWKRTGATRDGNKDAVTSFMSPFTDDEYEAWLEIKYRKDPRKNITSRAFDSTLISALESKKLRALYFATNAHVNPQLHFRVSSFHNKALPDLSTLRIYDGDSLESIKCCTEKINVDDLVIEGVFISDCIDYSNHNLTDVKSLSPSSFYYITIALFNPFHSRDEFDIDVFLNGIAVKSAILLENWNFLSFKFVPEFLDQTIEELRLTIGCNGDRKDVIKPIQVVCGKRAEIFYDQGYKLLNKFKSKQDHINGGAIRRFLTIVEGSSATGKTYIVENVCADWSSSHQIISVSFSGIESDDWGCLGRIIDFSFNNGIKVSSNSDGVGLDTDIEYLFTSRLSEIPARLKKLILIDDWQKASPNIRLKALDIIRTLIMKAENVSIALFSRPHIEFESTKESLPEFSVEKLLGPTKQDVEASLYQATGTKPFLEEVDIVFRVCTNLINLQCFIDLVGDTSNNKENVASLVKQVGKNRLLQIPTLSKDEYDLLTIIYLLPNGLKSSEIQLLPFGESTLFSLQANHLIKTNIEEELHYVSIHDLWTEEVLSNKQLITGNVINCLHALSFSGPSRRYSYLAAALIGNNSLMSEAFQEARKERDICINQTKFGEIRNLVEVIVSSEHHAPENIERISDPETAAIIASDYLSAGDTLNHCSHSIQALNMLDLGMKACLGHQSNKHVNAIYLSLKSEVYNIRYWNLDLDFLSDSGRNIFRVGQSQRENSALSVIQNRLMMANYLLDRKEEARELKRKSMRFCSTSDLPNERIHLIMDSAKNEMIYSSKKSIGLFSQAIREYGAIDRERRRVIVAKFQRESLRVKCGKGSFDLLNEYVCEIKLNGYIQEYINCIIDIATIYAYQGDVLKAKSSLSQISSHPDILNNRRKIFKFNQCQAIIAVRQSNNDNAEKYWKRAIKAVEHLRSSYLLVAKHNSQQGDSSIISWFLDDQELRDGTIFVDPRLW